MDVLLDFDATLLAGDVRRAGADLATDQGLKTAIVISLFTDARADDDDALPAGESDRRGWWGDLLAPNAANGKADRIGSRRWLYAREKQTAATARKVREADHDALSWLVDDGIAASVAVETEWTGRGILAERIRIARPGGETVDVRFDYLWEAV